MMEKLRSLKAETLSITDRSNREVKRLCPRTIHVPANLASRGPLPEDLYTPIPYAIPAQIFAASLAAVKGLDPDRPRTLTKVTQTL
jgi:glucosamine--fructose-6-phosphate aminotransferase (isomerizing)